MYYLGNRYLSLNILIVVLSEFLLTFVFAFFLSALEIGEDGRMGVMRPSPEKTFLMTIVYLGFLYLFDLFSSENYRPTRRMIIRLLQAVGSATVAVTIIYSIVPRHTPGTKHIIAYTFFLPFLLIAWRSIFIEVLSKNFPEKRILILGFGKQGQMIAKEILKWYGHGIQVAGFIEENPKRFTKSEGDNNVDSSGNATENRRHPSRRGEDVKLLGGYGDIEKIVGGDKIYMVIVALPDRRANLPMSALLNCKDR
ncbi:MAG: nucleoside-diphosphate sugar epimerase/dehydratase [Nitrospinota bacterium]